MATYTDIPLHLPEFISLRNTGLISRTSANFYRTAYNTNVSIYIPAGTETNSISSSADVYLPNAIFNSKNETATVKYTNNKDVFIMGEVTCLHNILIQFKINKADGTNFSNQRAVRITLVRQDGTTYDQSICANYQPDTGHHVTAILNGNIIHTIRDIIKIKINLVQDSKLNDNSDTLLTIFNISWNIEILKNK